MLLKNTTQLIARQDSTLYLALGKWQGVSYCGIRPVGHNQLTPGRQKRFITLFVEGMMSGLTEMVTSKTQLREERLIV